MAKVLDHARDEAVKMGDEFISVEHLFWRCWALPPRPRKFWIKRRLSNPAAAPERLEVGRLDYETVLRELSKIRGGQRITDPEPESKYQVIEKIHAQFVHYGPPGKARTR